MRGKHVEGLKHLPEVNAAAVVEKLLADMRAAVIAGNVPKYENLSDQLAVFSRAYVIPSVKSDWDKYHLTGAETIIAELLHSKMGETVRRTSMMDAIYFSQPDDEPEIKIIDIFICKIRKKLKDSPYRVITAFGCGYKMVELCTAAENAA